MGKRKQSGHGNKGPQKVTPFAWNDKRQSAATLLAEGKLTDTEIAAQVKVSRKTLWEWKAHPDFAARIAANVTALAASGLKHAIAHREHRIADLQRLYDDLWRVKQERGADPTMQDVPGGKTGLLVRTTRGLGSGENFRTVEEYELDAALVDEIVEIQEKAAVETGQRKEKTPGGETTNVIQVVLHLPEKKPRPDEYRPNLGHQAAVGTIPLP